MAHDTARAVPFGHGMANPITADELAAIHAASADPAQSFGAQSSALAVASALAMLDHTPDAVRSGDRDDLQRHLANLREATHALDTAALCEPDTADLLAALDAGERDPWAVPDINGWRARARSHLRRATALLCKLLSITAPPRGYPSNDPDGRIYREAIAAIVRARLSAPLRIAALTSVLQQRAHEYPTSDRYGRVNQPPGDDAADLRGSLARLTLTAPNAPPTRPASAAA